MIAELENTLEILAIVAVSGIVLIGVFLLIYGIREIKKKQ